MNQDVLLRAQNYLTSSSDETSLFLSQSNIGVYSEENSATNFKIGVVQSVEKNDLIELNVQSISSNWRTEPFLVRKDIKIGVVVSCVIGIHGKDGLPIKFKRNPDTPIIYLGRNLGENVSGTGQPCFLLSNESKQIHRETVTFYKGQDIGNQYTNLMYIHSQLRTLNKAVFNLSFWQNEAIEIVGLVKEETSEELKSFNCSSDMIFNSNDIGAVIGSNGAFSMKLAGFKPVKVLFGTDSTTFQLQTPPPYPQGVVGMYWQCYMDFYNDIPFQVYREINQTLVSFVTSRDKIILARVLGIPHDILIPHEYIHLLSNRENGSKCFEFEVIWRSSFSNTGEVVGADGVFKEKFPNWMKKNQLMPKNTLYRQNYGLFYYDSTRKNYLYDILSEVLPKIMSLNEIFDVVFSLPENTMLTPKVSLSSQYIEGETNGYIGNTRNESIAYSRIQIESNDVANVDFDWFIKRPFYKAQDPLNTLYYKSGALFPPLSKPDYFVDNKQITVNLKTENIDIYGHTYFDGFETSLVQILRPINANTFGATVAETIAINDLTLSLMTGYTVPWNQPYDGINYGVLPTYYSNIDTANVLPKGMAETGNVSLTYTSQTVRFFKSSDFISLQQVAFGSGQQTTLLISPKNERLTYLQFQLLNEFQEEIEFINTLNGETPFTEASFTMKIFRSTHSSRDTLSSKSFPFIPLTFGKRKRK